MTRTEEVPIVLALREALVNMIIHRDYFEHTQSSVRIYHDRIEFYNPGATPRTVEEIIEDEVTAPRNPIIAKLFRMTGWEVKRMDTGNSLAMTFENDPANVTLNVTLKI